MPLESLAEYRLRLFRPPLNRSQQLPRTDRAVQPTIAQQRPRYLFTFLCLSVIQSFRYPKFFAVLTRNIQATVIRSVIFCSFYHSKHCAVSHCIRHKSEIFVPSLSPGQDSK